MDGYFTRLKKTRIGLFFSKKITRSLFLRVAFYYLCFLLFSTFLLMAPFSWIDQSKTWNFIDSFYVAASAISTTGLIIFDIGEELTFFGQFLIFILIFIGGLGLLFFKFWMFRIFKKLFLRGRATYISDNKEQHFERGHFRFKNTKEMIRISFIGIVGIQTLGVIILWPYFFYQPITNLPYHQNLAKSFWAALFHSVSATNNAGFDIFNDGTPLNSLQALNMHYPVQLVFIFQFVLGGIGFPVFYDLWQKWSQRKNFTKRKMHFFSKFVLFTYFSLLLFSLLVIFAIEGGYGKLKDMNFNYFMKVVFNSLSTRSAGYSTVDINTFFTQPTRYFMSFLMFVGCAPISTGGGIKVTTFFFVLISILWWKNDNKSNLFIGKRLILFSDILFALKIFFTAFFILSLLILITLFFPLNNNNVLNAIFHSASALGNVGLSSIIVKSNDSWVFKLFTIVAMLIGQIGIAQLIWFGRHKTRQFQPEEQKFPQEVLF